MRKFAASLAIFACLFFHLRFCAVVVSEMPQARATSPTSKHTGWTDAGGSSVALSQFEKLKKRYPYPKVKEFSPSAPKYSLSAKPLDFVVRVPGFVAAHDTCTISLRAPPAL